MRLKRFFNFSGKWRKGQSLVELTLVLTLLLTLLTGMVEFANLLNEYITVTDAAREGARFGSNDDPFIRPAMTLNAVFFLNVDQIVEGTFTSSDYAALISNPALIVRNPASKGALSPLRLRPEIGDDVVISVFSIDHGTLTRFPKGTGDDGWSFYHFKNPSTTHYRTSAFTTSQLENRLINTAPNTGFVLVEIFYSYDQILKLWAFIGAPDPIPVHTYAIMPLSAAEPTPGP
jgi:hypothetical protein